MTTKEQVLCLLQASNDWVSGENLSRQLGVSRMAIAKHIASLRNEEYLIESAPRRGYLFKLAPDGVDIETIKNALTTRTIGKGAWLFVKQTRSSNQEAQLLAAQGAAHGSIVLAQKQTNGRGRRGKEWFSAPRSACISIILRPDLGAQKLPVLSVIASLSVQKTLSEFEKLDALIKWPNDVLIHGKKMAGVLVETGFIAEEIEWVVVGIGCNLNVEASEFPEQIRDHVTSTFKETGQYYSRNLFYQRLLQWFDHYYHQLLDGKDASIITDANKVSVTPYPDSSA